MNGRKYEFRYDLDGSPSISEIGDTKMFLLWQGVTFSMSGE